MEEKLKEAETNPGRKMPLAVLTRESKNCANVRPVKKKFYEVRSICYKERQGFAMPLIALRRVSSLVIYHERHHYKRL